MEERMRPLRSSTRPRKPPSVTAILSILFFFMGILVLLFLQSPLGEIRDVQIRGNHMVTEEELLQLARLNEGSSYFHWDGKEAEERIAALPEVQEVAVSKTFPGTVVIEVKESERVAFWMDGSDAYPVLANGKVLTDRSWSDSLDKPLLRGWKKGSGIDPAFARGLADLPKRIQMDLSEIRPGNDPVYPDLVQVYTRNNHTVRVRMKDFAEKIPYYSMFRDRPPGTLNLLESTWFDPERE